MKVNGFIEEDINNSVSTEEEEEIETVQIGKIDNNNEITQKEPIPGTSNESDNTKKPKKRKKGIIFVSNIPKHMNVTRIREMLGQYGNIGRVFLQPEKLPISDKTKRKRKRIGRHFTEGWIEFESKRVAKQVASILNNTHISTKKRSQFYDCLWIMKYLPRFKWIHLTERLNYEKAVHKQRLTTEISQARREANFFQNNLDKSEMIKKRERKLKTDK